MKIPNSVSFFIATGLTAMPADEWIEMIDPYNTAPLSQRAGTCCNMGEPDKEVTENQVTLGDVDAVDPGEVDSQRRFSLNT